MNTKEKLKYLTEKLAAKEKALESRGGRAERVNKSRPIGRPGRFLTAKRGGV